MPAKKKKAMPSQARLRDIAWEVGQNYPVSQSSDYISLLMITPGQGHVHWNVRERTVNSLIKKKMIAAEKTRPVVRIHDVTDIIFDGTNSHKHFDLRVNKNEGHYTFSHDHRARHYIAELGFKSKGLFHAVARSEAVFFDNDRPSGNYSTAGLFSGGMLNRTFTVENIFDAPVYERMNHELSSINRKRTLSIAVVNVNVSGEAISNIGPYINNMTKGFIPVRKPGKLPAEVFSEDYELEYGRDKVEVHVDAIQEGAAYLVVDDLLATGGTAEATCRLIEKGGGKISGCLFLVELTDLGGRLRLNKRKVVSVIDFEGE